MHSEQINELAAALAKAQAKMANAATNRTNPHFKSKYADLASVLDSIREPLGSNGLSVVQTTEIREGGMVLRTMLMHASGQWMAGEYPLPATARPQEMGSALTYARRYSLSAIVCNSADEDDDANGAEDQKQKTEARGKAVVKPATGDSTAPDVETYVERWSVMLENATDAQQLSELWNAHKNARNNITWPDDDTFDRLKARVVAKIAALREG